MRVEFQSTTHHRIYNLIYYVDSDYITFEGYTMFNFDAGEFQPTSQDKSVTALLNTKSHQEIAKKIAANKKD